MLKILSSDFTEVWFIDLPRKSFIFISKFKTLKLCFLVLIISTKCVPEIQKDRERLIENIKLRLLS